MNGKKLIITAFGALFLATACYNPFFGNFHSQTPGIWDTKAEGTPFYAYLDADYNVLPNGPDTGKTAVIIVDNPLVEGVFSIAAQTAGYDDAVCIGCKGTDTDTDTDTIIAMFFHEGQRFPWQIIVNSDGESATARLLGYEWGYERFSLEFEENGIKTAVNDIPLSRDALLSYQNNPSLTNSQNIRLRNIYAALAVYESISRVFLKSNVGGSMLKTVFTDRSLVSFTVAVKPERQIYPIAEYSLSKSPPHFLGLIIWAIISSVTSPPAPPPTPPQLEVAITTGGDPVDPEAIYYLDHGEEIIFNFDFTNFTQDTNVTAVLYEPDLHVYTYFHTLSPTLSYSGFAFSYTQEDNSPLGRFAEHYKIKVRRNSLIGEGFNNGNIALVVFFGQNTVVNKSFTGINFWEPGASGPESNSSVFVLRFTIRPKNASS